MVANAFVHCASVDAATDSSCEKVEISLGFLSNHEIQRTEANVARGHRQFLLCVIAAVVVAGNAGVWWWFANHREQHVAPQQTHVEQDASPAEPSFADFADDAELRRKIASLGPDVQFFDHEPVPLQEAQAAIAEKPPSSLAPSPSIPGELRFPTDAAPIGSRGSLTEDDLRSLIKEKMPRATASEQQVWVEELHGLPLAMVHEILALRSDVKGRSTSDAPPPIKTDTWQPPRMGTSLAAQTQPTLAALQQAQRIVLHNIENANTTGYRSRRIVWRDVEAETREAKANGAKVLRTLLRTESGSSCETRRPLDLAISGAGFFAVKFGNGIAYSRAGCLAVDSEQRLAVMVEDGTCPLDPPIMLPKETAEITITRAGQVRTMNSDESQFETRGQILLTTFLDASTLKPLGDGLYAATPESGECVSGKPDGDRFGDLLQGFVERSNVDLEEELAAFRELQETANRLQELAGVSPTPSPSRPPAHQPVARAPSSLGKTRVASQRSLIDEFLDRTRIRAIKRSLTPTTENAPATKAGGARIESRNRQ